jgi:hypothetical protein
MLRGGMSPDKELQSDSERPDPQRGPARGHSEAIAVICRVGFFATCGPAARPYSPFVPSPFWRYNALAFKPTPEDVTA